MAKKSEKTETQPIYLNIEFIFKELKIKTRINKMRGFFDKHGLQFNNSFFAKSNLESPQKIGDSECYYYSFNIPESYLFQELPEFVFNTNFSIKLEISKYNGDYCGQIKNRLDVDKLFKDVYPNETIYTRSSNQYKIFQKSLPKKIEIRSRYLIETKEFSDEDINDVKENMNFFKSLYENELTKRFNRPIEAHFDYDERITLKSFDEIDQFSFTMCEGRIITTPNIFRTKNLESRMKFSITDDKKNVCSCEIRDPGLINYLSSKLYSNCKVCIQGELNGFNVDRQNYLILPDYLHIVDAFIPTSYLLKDSKTLQILFENTEKGLYIKNISHNDGDVSTSREAILRSPLRLIDVYKGETKKLYEIELANEIYRAELSKLAEELVDNPDIVETDIRKLSKPLRNIVRQMELDRKLVPKEIYCYPGVHLDENKNFVLVFPGDDHILIGENEAQKTLISEMENLDYDETGEGYQNFLSLFEFEGMPMVVRTFVMGLLGFLSFSDAISNKEADIEVFPNLTLVGKPSSGKTTIIRLMTQNFFGNPIITGRSFDSESRAAEYATICTFPQGVDEINKLKDERVVDMLKTLGTTRAPIKRKLPNHKWLEFHPHASFAYSANNIKWINDDQALREGRMLICEYKRKAEKKYLKPFKRIKTKITKSKLMGKYFLKTAIEFIRLSSQEEISDQQKLIRYLNLKETELIKYCDKHKVP